MRCWVIQLGYHSPKWEMFLFDVLMIDYGLLDNVKRGRRINGPQNMYVLGEGLYLWDHGNPKIVYFGEKFAHCI